VRVDQLMSSRALTVVDGNLSVLEAANAMRDCHVGVLPVVSCDIFVGVLTDRDIVERVVTRELNPRTTRVAHVMTSHAATCFADDDVETAVDRMLAHGVRRLVVLQRKDSTVLGILSVDDLARVPEHPEWALSVLDRLVQRRLRSLEGAQH
jgi:CBS domain-containing protein